MTLKGLAFARSDRATIAGLLALAFAAPASGQIFKCIDPSGHTTYQQTACPPSATGGRVELTVDVGVSHEPDPIEAAWEAAAREKNVSVGMPQRFVRVALGSPREARAGRADENATEVWSYQKDAQTVRIGFRNDVVAWTRYGSANAASEPPPDDEMTQRVLRRRNVSEGENCDDVVTSLGPPQEIERRTGQPGVLRYVWEPVAGDPYARTIVGCTLGRVTSVERLTAR